MYSYRSLSLPLRARTCAFLHYPEFFSVYKHLASQHLYHPLRRTLLLPDRGICQSIRRRRRRWARHRARERERETREEEEKMRAEGRERERNRGIKMRKTKDARRKQVRKISSPPNDERGGAPKGAPLLPRSRLPAASLVKARGLIRSRSPGRRGAREEGGARVLPFLVSRSFHAPAPLRDCRALRTARALIKRDGPILPRL